MQTVHPDGKDGHLLLSNIYSPTLADYAFTPQLGMTYTLNPDTVLRFSAGRYAQEPRDLPSSVQRQGQQSGLRSLSGLLAVRLYDAAARSASPVLGQLRLLVRAALQGHRHVDQGDAVSTATRPIRSTASALPFGLSRRPELRRRARRRLRGRVHQGRLQQERALVRDSRTRTPTPPRTWANYPGHVDQPDRLRTIKTSPTSTVSPRPAAARNATRTTSTATSIPIRAARSSSRTTTRRSGIRTIRWQPQPLLDRNGWYPVGLDFAYLSPNVLSAIVNYKHNKFAITPALTFNEGSAVRQPGRRLRESIRASASSNSAASSTRRSTPRIRSRPTTRPASRRQRKTELRPARSTFPIRRRASSITSAPSAQPSQLNLSLQMAYQLTPRVKVNALLANLVNACFGGSSEPWTKQFPPNGYTCGYHRELLLRFELLQRHVAERPRGQRRSRSTPAFKQSFIPAYADTNSFVLPNPFNAYSQFNVTLVSRRPMADSAASTSTAASGSARARRRCPAPAARSSVQGAMRSRATSWAACVPRPDRSGRRKSVAASAPSSSHASAPSTLSSTRGRLFADVMPMLT